MFILRSVYPLSEGAQVNEIIGDNYSIIRKSTNPEAFERATREVYSGQPFDGAFAYLVSSDGSNHRPLYSGNEYYIMMESGSTFERIHEH